MSPSSPGEVADEVSGTVVDDVREPCPERLSDEVNGRVGRAHIASVVNTIILARELVRSAVATLGLIAVR